MSEPLHVITGATGQLGSHIAQQLAASGQPVRALVRPTSQTDFLRGLGVDLVIADLMDAASLDNALAGGGVLYHCAAKVDDCGPWGMYQTEIIDTTRSVMQGAARAKIPRVVHVSSLAAYGHPDFSRKVYEGDPLAQYLRVWDYYCLAKAQSEVVARQAVSHVTIIRPSLLFGERERSVFSRIIATMRRGKAKLLGSGDNLLNIVYAGDVAAGAILAATTDKARGQVYNLASEGEITQRQLYEKLATALSLPPVTGRVPLKLAHKAAMGLEIFARLLFGPRPIITRHGISLICRPVEYSIDKARTDLGWQPATPAAEGLDRMLRSMQS